MLPSGKTLWRIYFLFAVFFFGSLQTRHSQPNTEHSFEQCEIQRQQPASKTGTNVIDLANNLMERQTRQVERGVSRIVDNQPAPPSRSIEINQTIERQSVLSLMVNDRPKRRNRACTHSWAHCGTFDDRCAANLMERNDNLALVMVWNGSPTEGYRQLRPDYSTEFAIACFANSNRASLGFSSVAKLRHCCTELRLVEKPKRVVSCRP